jgi:diguanylate cyclase (GGDEF)-like protein/PAS domain S-box-containing protein
VLRIDRLLKQTENRVRRQNNVLVDLARRPSIHSGELGPALRDLAEAAADTLDVERLGIWFYTPDRQSIRCAELYERTPRLHTSGGELTAANYPVYFKALESERTITADDALIDPRTSAFSENYLSRHGVSSMLDAPIRRRGQLTGVVCVEHVGPRRTWTLEDESFTSALADLVTMALDATERRDQQIALQHRLDFETLIGTISTRFANAGDAELDDVIVDGLKDLAQFVGVPRAHVFLLLEDGLSARLAYEWNEDAHSFARRDLYGELPTAAFPWWAARLRAGETVRWLHPEELPPEAANERRLAERYGIISALFLPLRVQKELAGSVGLSSVTEPFEWSDETIRLMRIAADIIGSALERIRAFDALRASEERYRLMAENSTDVISRTTGDGLLSYASDAVRNLLGYEPHEMIGRPVLDFVHPDDHHLVKRFFAAMGEARTPHTFAYRAVRKDGSTTWFETTSRVIADAHTQTLREIVGVSRDITERRRAEEQIEYQAYHDSLTGLPNRLLFRDRLTIALAHARRLETPVAVMFLDLDRFKVVNDTLGHSLGDELLRIVAERLRSELREGDTIARMGGDEFTVLLGDLKDADFAAAIAQKLLDVVAQPIRLQGHDLYLTTSIGLALFPTDGETAEALLQSADSAMYRAKDLGRNAFQMCSAAMNTRAVERLSVENALRHAVDRGELAIHYQPIVMLESGDVAGMEALLRWNRPGHGLVPPAQFIEIAEETRLILPIGEWVLREACKRAVQWQSAADAPRRVSVNLSPRQFQQSNLLEIVGQALAESGLPADALELEITESTAMLNTERTMATLADLRALGVHIALDDFGTGHSSLNYLRRFPIDRVKIDREFVQGIEESASDRAIIAAIVTMAHGLNMAVTAEGVETEPQATFLRDQHCEEVQGFLFGRPRALGLG